MKRALVRVLSPFAVFTLIACSSNAITRPVPYGASSFSATEDGDVPFRSAGSVRHLCSAPATPDTMQCLAMVRTDLSPGAHAALHSEELQNCKDEFSEGYCPIDLQNAYHLPSLTAGSGKVVAIVDAYGYRHAAGDLSEYRQTMGLKACSVKTKCLRIVNQNGATSPLPPEPPASQDWKGEQSLDLDMVSAICPKCKIILVQTENNQTTNLFAGVKTAGHLGAKYIGASWGQREFSSDNPIFHQAGVVISAAAGDEGGGGSKGGPFQPCTYTYVICVGGTHLVRAKNDRGWSETVWNDWTFDQCGGPCGATGSGCSKEIVKPAWQTDHGCTTRSESDISATASLRSAVIVYNSEEGGGPCPNSCFWLYGGTSASTQIISAVFALAGNAANQDGASHIWKNHQGNVYDVKMGNNIDANLGVNCASSLKYICNAQVGFDGPTGWGTPNGIGAF